MGEDVFCEWSLLGRRQVGRTKHGGQHAVGVLGQGGHGRGEDGSSDVEGDQLS